ncbi:MAG TPA: N-formylglutamate amidohydrolase [Acidobacteriota bacterium]|nr:N-formylglutamate amidohydrolase [Acidobacteriota bacterium]
MSRLVPLVTCEHGGNEVPVEHRSLFEGRETALASHQGYDPGALPLAREISRRLNAPLFHSTTTRLLIELNRSLSSRRLFSRFSRSLPRRERERILERHYHRYRDRAEAFVREAAGRNRTVCHISIHSFAPILNGKIRDADVGILYDPRRSAEKRFAGKWATCLRDRSPFRVRRNFPYLGRADGLTSSLRALFDERTYLGLELEVNQALYYARAGAPWRRLCQVLAETLAAQLWDGIAARQSK